MVHIHVNSQGIDDLIARIRNFAPGEVDLAPLGDSIAEILIRKNQEARLAGVDREGNPLAPISPETVKRRRRAGKGDGPPLAPDESASRTAQMSVNVNKYSNEHVRLVGRWPTAEPWLKYHVEGVPSHNLPVRDIVGTTPEMNQEIGRATYNFASEQFFSKTGG